MEGQSSYVAELPRSDACSYSYNSEILDSRTRSSEGSFDSAKSITLESVKQELSAQTNSPNVSSCLSNWTSAPMCYGQDIQIELPATPTFAAEATDHVYDSAGAPHHNYPEGETDLEGSSNLGGI